MSDEDLKTLRSELEQWLEEHLAVIVGEVDPDDAPTLPQICDFSLAIAWEDISDPESSTHYSTVSSYVPAYRIFGLLCAVIERFRGPTLPYGLAGDD